MQTSSRSEPILWTFYILGQGSEVTEDVKEFEKRARTNFNASMNFYTDKLFAQEAASPLEVSNLSARMTALGLRSAYYLKRGP